MGNIEFNEDQGFQNYDAYEQEGPSGLIGLLIKIGLAKNKQSANTVLIVIGIVAIIIMIGAFIFGGNKDNNSGVVDPGSLINPVVNSRFDNR